MIAITNCARDIELSLVVKRWFWQEWWTWNGEKSSLWNWTNQVFFRIAVGVGILSVCGYPCD
jgi:hypothetical protein